ncbi:hypothetical protein GWI33_005756 [Rhynchophorus ferrugineus]|uniref:Uncharacterized protein n=1 Tax=Rhynchophorus ferrugineus TaxID=354439 RepID=A0A834IMF8_RHYFE|nr:hypothetical protein GWI33_005756 [Rhynchophorus ferrugineus]
MAFVRTLMVIAVLKVSSYGLGTSNEERKTALMFELLTPHVEKDQYKLCLNESNLTTDELQEQKTQLSERKLCYIKCMALKVGFLLRDGTVLINKAREMLPRKIFTPSDVDDITTCLSHVKDMLITCNDIKKMLRCFKLPNLQQ